jgi:TolB protein
MKSVMTDLFSSRRALLAAGALSPVMLSPLMAAAQFRVEVSGVGMTQIPVTVAVFRGNNGLPADVAAVVRANLERSGRLRMVEVPMPDLDEAARPDLGPVKDKGSDALVVGSVSRLADGRLDVRFRLWDAVKAQDLGGQSFPVGAADLRLAAHRVADYVYEKLTGEKGVFSTRIAYISRSGNRHHLWVADADGENARSALGSPEPIISPAWSPNGQQLAYVSFEARKSVIYVHDVATGRRRLLASFRGSNSAPAWAPDGNRLAMALSLSGNAQIYVMGVSGGDPKRLTQTSSIDTEPAFAADGKSIYFVSDRGGSPQIYRMGAGGENPQRLTFTGNYNISPAPSPDGRLLAYVSRVGGAFRLHVMDLSSGQVTALTDTSADESPSFAPNSRLIIYATKLQGKEALMTCTPDGRVKTRLSGVSGDIREPDWGPFAA